MNTIETSPIELFDNAVLGGIISSWTTYDIIKKFQSVLQDGSTGSVTSPPVTTKRKEVIFKINDFYHIFQHHLDTVFTLKFSTL